MYRCDSKTNERAHFFNVTSFTHICDCKSHLVKTGEKQIRYEALDKSSLDAIILTYIQ